MALETLATISSAVDEYRRQLQLDLEDAVAIPWTCTRLKVLELAINLGGDVDGEDDDDWDLEAAPWDGSEDCAPSHQDAELLKIFYPRELPMALTESKRERIRPLEKLYRQLGSLPLVDTLELYVATTLGRAVDYCCCSFPGMLVLKDREKGGPEFLKFLGGLNLRRLVGSVSPYTRETRLALGHSETQWMLAHWPKLERIEFDPPGSSDFEGHGSCRNRLDDGCLQ
ncbi:hypothetical protein BGZ47_002475 [Haplosporangium gracile]|nr:hypothetical protein BGZ47_002475 [Haplosporangium gracile]